MRGRKSAGVEGADLQQVRNIAGFARFDCVVGDRDMSAPETLAIVAFLVEYADQVDQRGCTGTGAVQRFLVIGVHFNHMGVGQQPGFARVIAAAGQDTYAIAGGNKMVGEHVSEETAAAEQGDDG